MLASITKPMTATLATVLVEEGVIGWGTTVGEVFPDFAETTRPEYAEVRLDELENIQRPFLKFIVTHFSW